MRLSIPELALVILIGPSGSGKSTFGRAHFLPSEVISSDACRALVADDENEQGATADAFALLHYLVGLRLKRGLLTVVDATNVQPEARRSLVALAHEHDVLPVAIVLDLPERVCLDRNAARADRDFGGHVVKRQRDALRRSLRSLRREGFRAVHVLSSVEEVAAARIVRTPLRSARSYAGPRRTRQRTASRSTNAPPGSVLTGAVWCRATAPADLRARPGAAAPRSPPPAAGGTTTHGMRIYQSSTPFMCHPLHLSHRLCLALLGLDGPTRENWG